MLASNFWRTVAADPPVAPSKPVQADSLGGLSVCQPVRGHPGRAFCCLDSGAVGTCGAVAPSPASRESGAWSCGGIALAWPLALASVALAWSRVGAARGARSPGG